MGGGGLDGRFGLPVVQGVLYLKLQTVSLGT